MSMTLKPWYAIAIPPKDISEGRLAEAVLAADLWTVVQGTAPESVPRPRGVLPQCGAVGAQFLVQGRTHEK